MGIMIKELKKYYGSQKGIEQVTLEVKSGQIYGFIGPNGAGKSTTIKCLMNFLFKDSGDITWEDDERLNHLIHLDKVGYMPAEVLLYPDLTLKQMIGLNANFYKEKKAQVIQQSNAIAELLEIPLNQKFKALSFGNRKKVGIVLALAHDPDYIIMDEPSSGLDPLMQDRLYELLGQLKAQGKTIFFSSHVLSEVELICDQIAFIKSGTVIEIGSIHAIKNKALKKVSFTASNDLMASDIPDANDFTKGNLEDRFKYQFFYKGSDGELVGLLNQWSIDQLEIHTATLEDQFRIYYRE